MAKNTKQSFEFNRTERLRRTIFLEDSSEDESFEYNNRTKTSNYSIYFQKLNYTTNIASDLCYWYVGILPIFFHYFPYIIKNLNLVLLTMIIVVQSVIKCGSLC